MIERAAFGCPPGLRYRTEQVRGSIASSTRSSPSVAMPLTVRDNVTARAQPGWRLRPRADGREAEVVALARVGGAGVALWVQTSSTSGVSAVGSALVSG